MTTAAAGLFLSPIAFLFPSLVQQGAQTFVQIRYPEATRDYSTALNGSSDSAIVLWRLARVYSCRADISLPDAKLDLYRQAEDLAHRCIEVDSTIPEGHAWRAAALGNIAMFEGGENKDCALLHGTGQCQLVRTSFGRHLPRNSSRKRLRGVGDGAAESNCTCPHSYQASPRARRVLYATGPRARGCRGIAAGSVFACSRSE
jgi:hypothetical protein